MECGAADWQAVRRREQTKADSDVADLPAEQVLMDIPENAIVNAISNPRDEDLHWFERAIRGVPRFAPLFVFRA
jgi:hypothetical protein